MVDYKHELYLRIIEINKKQDTIIEELKFIKAKIIDVERSINGV